MADDSSPLATKKDLKEFVDMLMKQQNSHYEANQKWKDGPNGKFWGLLSA